MKFTELLEHARARRPIFVRAAIGSGQHSVARALARALGSDAVFRAPHHTASVYAMLGVDKYGRASPYGGEITMAADGLLFLDDCNVFMRDAQDAIAAAVKGGASFSLVCAVLPCPCGMRGARAPRSAHCHCDDRRIQRIEALLAPSMRDVEKRGVTLDDEALAEVVGTMGRYRVTARWYDAPDCVTEEVATPSLDDAAAWANQVATGKRTGRRPADYVELVDSVTGRGIDFSSSAARNKQQHR